MNMFANMMGQFIDKEQATIDTIKDAMAEVAEENKLTHKDFCFMIQPKTEQFDFKVYIVKLSSEGKPVGILREITVKEIVGTDDEEKEESSG